MPGSVAHKEGRQRATRSLGPEGRLGRGAIAELPPPPSAQRPSGIATSPTFTARSRASSARISISAPQNAGRAASPAASSARRVRCSRRCRVVCALGEAVSVLLYALAAAPMPRRVAQQWPACIRCLLHAVHALQ